jgi:hypothetical protein
VCFDEAYCVLNDKYDLIFVLIEFYYMLDLRHKLSDCECEMTC